MRDGVVLYSRSTSTTIFMRRWRLLWPLHMVHLIRKRKCTAYVLIYVPIFVHYSLYLSFLPASGYKGMYYVFRIFTPSMKHNGWKNLSSSRKTSNQILCWARKPCKVVTSHTSFLNYFFNFSSEQKRKQSATCFTVVHVWLTYYYLLLLFLLHHRKEALLALYRIKPPSSIHSTICRKVDQTL